jgi:hypothetical protein
MLVDHMLVSRQKEEGSSVDQVIFKIDQVKVQAQDGHLGEITCLKLAIHMVIMVM